MPARRIAGRIYEEVAVRAVEPLPVTIEGADVTINAEIGSTVEISNDAGNPIPVSDAGGSLTVDGPLTDTELRATAVPVSGPLTDTQLRATAVPVSSASLPLPSGAATDANQATIIGHVDGIEGHVDGIEGLLTTIDTDTGSIDGKLPALSSGRIPVDIGAISLGDVEIKNDAGNPVPVSGPLTDTQLRATAVPVSGTVTATGPLTDTQLRATAVPVSGPLTDTQLRATAVPVSGTVAATGPLTDTELRATAVPVSGPLTDTQLRAAAVPVSGTVTSQVAVRTPTTTSVASSVTSVSVLASNAARRGFSISNVSTSKLYLTFGVTASVATSFIEVPAGAFLLLDQQLIVTNAISGIWAAANGTAQVTEFE